MKQTIFTLKEEEFMIPNLKMRLESYGKSGGYSKHEKIIEEIFEKINSDWDKFYGSKHKLQITSVINEFMYPYKERENEFLNLLPFRFIELTENDKKDLELFDLCYGILEKTDYKKSKFRFAHIFRKIDRLKNCEKIYLSRTGDDNVYRITFIDNGEVLKWEMSLGANILKDDFYKIPATQLRKFSSTFTDYLSRDEASQMIKKCKPIGASEDTLKFTKYLLN